MADPDPTDAGVPLSDLAPEVKAERAGSFGEVASEYERFRPGPPAGAVTWVVPEHVARIVDLGAGTGALTRLLVGRADEVVAIEPDERMRSVLVASVPGIRAVEGRGESIPLPDACADAVLASSSWHWMDPVPTLHEVGRVLVPGGTLAATVVRTRSRRSVLRAGPGPPGPTVAGGGGGRGRGRERFPTGASPTISSPTRFVRRRPSRYPTGSPSNSRNITSSGGTSTSTPTSSSGCSAR